MLRVGVKMRNWVGVKMRNCEVRQDEDRVSHMIFADSGYPFAESKEHILKMIGDATEELKREALTGRRTRWN